MGTLLGLQLDCQQCCSKEPQTETPLVTNHDRSQSAHNISLLSINGLDTINENDQIKELKKDIIDGFLTKTQCNMDNVAKHHSFETGIWIVIDTYIYDITSFVQLHLHPASNVFIEPYYGKDATDAFNATCHSNDAMQLLKKYKIGQLSEPQHGGDISMTPSTLNNIYVSSIFIYPVKGCKGISVSAASLSTSGFLNDRIYAFCNKKTNKVINQLTHRKLSQININFIDGTNDCDKGIKINNKIIPFMKNENEILFVEWESSSTKLKVYHQGSEISKWITKFINQTNQEFILVRLHEDNYRETEECFALPFAPKSSQQMRHEMSGFQNHCPVLLCSEESLTELNKRYKKEIDIGNDDEKQINWDRFRMNIIVKGLPIAHYEDCMKHIRFGVELNRYAESDQVEILWSRRRYFCAVCQVNQKNSIQTQQPITTARPYRNAITLNDRTSLPGDEAVFFGSFYCVKHSGMVRVGQQVIHQHEELDFNTGLTIRNTCSKLEINYHSQYEDFVLIKKEVYNHDTIKFRFKMINKSHQQYNQTLKESLSLGDNYLLKFIDHDGNLIIRAYTPMFDDYENDDEKDENHQQCFDILVKIYLNGKMSQYLKNMKINDVIQCKQNYGKVCYVEIGKIRFGDPRFTMFLPFSLNIKKINLIAGGSGITPIFQIITNINLNKQYDDTQISLIYGNKTVQDILLKHRLQQIAKINKNINIHFVISRPNKYENIPKYIDIGRISKDMCKKHLFPPNKNNDVVSLLCGPYAMEQSVKQFLYDIGHDEKSVAVF